MVATKSKGHTFAGLLLLGLVLLFSVLHTGHASADSATLIGMVNNGDIYVKAGSTTAPWTTRLTTGEQASDLQMYGDRVGFIDGSNDLWLKQGLTSQWYEEMNNVESFALTENGLIALQFGGNVWYKSGQSPTAQWDSNLMDNDGAHVYLSPSQMVIIDNSGNLLGKVLTPLDDLGAVGPNGPWSPIASNATAAAVTDSRLVYVDNQQNVYGKNGPIWYSWWNNKQVIDDRTVQVGLSGTMYCAMYSDSGTEVACKPYSFADLPMFVFGSTVNSFALSPGVIVVYGNDGDGSLDPRGLDYSKINSGDNGYSLVTPGWNIESTTGTEITTNQE